MVNEALDFPHRCGPRCDWVLHPLLPPTPLSLPVQNATFSSARCILQNLSYISKTKWREQGVVPECSTKNARACNEDCYILQSRVAESPLQSGRTSSALYRVSIKECKGLPCEMPEYPVQIGRISSAECQNTNSKWKNIQYRVAEPLVQIGGISSAEWLRLQC